MNRNQVTETLDHIYGNKIFSYSLHLRNDYRERWLRLHTLPNGKRYAESIDEQKSILDLQKQVLRKLFGDQRLVVILSDWTNNKINLPKVNKLEKFNVEYWKTILHNPDEGEDEFKIYRHIYLIELEQSDAKLNTILNYVSEDLLAGAIITSMPFSDLVLPYNGGIDVVANSLKKSINLKSDFAEWLPNSASGL